MLSLNSIRVSNKLFSRYTSISQAVRDAKPGTRILVAPGTYNENIVIDKNIEIIGEGHPSDVIIIGEMQSCISVNNSTVQLKGLTIKQGGIKSDDSSKAAVLIDSGAAKIKDCNIQSSVGACIIIENSRESTTIEKCYLGDSEGAGIYVFNANAIIEQCEITKNNHSNIIISGLGNVNVKNSDISHSNYLGVWINDNGSGIIENCEIYENEQSNISIDTQGNLQICKCKIYKSKHAGIYVHEKGLGVIEDCDIFENGRANIVINTEGNPQINNCKIFKSNQSGIYVTEKGLGVVNNCEIYENKNANIAIETEGNTQISNCKIYKSKDAGIFVYEKGLGLVNNCEIYENENANITIETEGNPQIRNCKIYKSKDCGIFVYKKGLGFVENSEIYENGLANIAIKTQGNPQIDNCKIYKSTQPGIYVYKKGQGVVDNCDIYENELSNIAIETEGNPQISNCKIYKGKDAAIFVYEKGLGVIDDCDMYENISSNVVIKKEGNPQISNCKIHKSNQSGIYVTEKGLGVINNCEIYENEQDNIAIETQGNPQISNCKIYIGKDAGIFVCKIGLGVIDNCDVYENVSSNVVIKEDGNPQISNSKIHNSKQAGIYVYEKGLGAIDNCDIYENELSNVAIETQGNPQLCRCKIYNSKDSGICVYENGLGIIENCEIFENELSNTIIRSEGNPQISKCKNFKSKQAGIYIYEKGLGVIDNCEIYENELTNIAVATEGNPQICRCKIYKGNDAGIRVYENGLGLIENCEIYGNENDDITISDDSSAVIKSCVDKISQTNEQADYKDESKNQEISEPSLALKSVLEELDSLIGMNNIKEQIRKTIQYIEFNNELKNLGVESTDIKLAAAHTVLYGNPGTGKTTVAKILGKLYYAMGLLSSGEVIQVNREKLVGKYIGHTAPQTKEWIDKAIGGVLFIDEAYELTNKGVENDFGPEAIAVLLEEMENRKGEFIVIVAGYDQDMQQFLEVNPGLKSRFTQFFHLEDYVPEEMTAIANKMVNEKHRKITSEALDLLLEEFTALWRKRDKFFSNARIVRNYIESIMQAQADRCMRIPRKEWTKDVMLTLTAADVRAVLKKEEKKEFKIPVNEELLQEALGQLNRMIGMKNVKQEIEKLVTLVRYYKEENKDFNQLSPHTLLVGSPGTGKTEVARIIAKIYEALGIMERGDLIEVNRDKLVSPYSG